MLIHTSRRYARLHLLALLCALAISAGGSALATVLFIHFKIWPYDLLRASRYGYVLEAGAHAPYSTSPIYTPGQSITVKSTFLDLEIETFDRQDRQSWIAGSLEVVDDRHVLLIEGEGRVFLLDVDALSEQALDITPPDNGLAALHAVSDPGENHVTGRLHRYTDVKQHDGQLFVAHSHFDAERACFTNRLARTPLEGDIRNAQITAEDWTVLFETAPCLPFRNNPSRRYRGNEAGGRMAFDQHGQLYLTIGYFGFDGLEEPDIVQGPDSLYGKVVRIDPANGDAQVVSTGHRNPQGIAFDGAGQLWVTEHGPQGGDELNHIVEGSNYGWPLVTYGTNYGERSWPINRLQGDHSGFRKPAFAWVPSIAASGLTFADGVHPFWQGDFIVPSLMDRALHRVVVDGTRVVTLERIPLGERLRAVVIVQGRLVVLCASGNVIRITLKAPEDTAPALVAGDQVEPLVRAALATCLDCHSRDDATRAPSLCAVEGRRVAGSDYAAYSPALRAAGGVWTRARLDAYLEDTRSVAPDGVMPNQGIADPALRQAIIDNLDYFCS